jgi:hypothetical protein
MKIAFRIECPHCHWGSPWSDNYVNMGWVKLRCGHCDEEFYTKITINNVDIAISKELPSGRPCQSVERSHEPIRGSRRAFEPYEGI